MESFGTPSPIVNFERTKFRYYDALGIRFFLYVGVFAIVALGILPKDLLLVAALLIFMTSKKHEMTYIYIFSLPWMSVAVFSFGPSLSLIQSIVYVIKIVLVQKTIKMDVYEFVYLAFLAISGAINFIYFRSLTGISFVFYFLIANEIVHDNLMKVDNSSHFWRVALYSILISCLFASIYGITHATTIQRWIRGLGYASQFSGTMGTTRFGIYLCICTLFALYYIENKWAKVTVAVILAIGVIATVSMTAFILLLFIYLFYYLTQGKLSGKKNGIIVTTIIIIGLIFLFWDKISEIPTIKPLATRIELITQQMEEGDINAATSGRSGLTDTYLNQYMELNIVGKTFGTYNLSSQGTTHSHNSYIDMLLYGGAFGILLGIGLQIKRIIQYANKIEFKMYLIFKLIIIVAAATVSIFTAQYWQIWFYI